MRKSSEKRGRNDVERVHDWDIERERINPTDSNQKAKGGGCCSLQLYINSLHEHICV